MKPIDLPIVGGSYRGVSSVISPEVCRNFRIEEGPEGLNLVGTPGLTLRATIGNGPIRGAHRLGAYVYIVSGKEVYRMTEGHAVTLLGSLNTSTGPVSMADNMTDVLIVDGTSSAYAIVAGTWTPVTDIDFMGATMVTYQDGYFICVVPDSATYMLFDLYSATSVLDTDFAVVENQPRQLRAAISDHHELWLLKESSGAVHFNSGDPDFPFTPMQAGNMESGIAAPFSLCKFDNSLMWLSSNEHGHGQVVQAAGGYTPVVISPTPVSWHISRYSRIDDAFAFSYKTEGHEVYVLTFPTANRTWCYDAVTKMWNLWSSNLDDDAESRHRANCHCFAFGRHYVGDYASGMLYTIESDVYTENGAPIIRDRITVNMSDKEKMIRFAEVEVTAEVGVGISGGSGDALAPQLMLRWSKNGGKTWSSELTRSLGRVGEYAKRLVWRKLGRSRQWAFWLRVSAPVKVVITGAIGRRRDDADEARESA